MLSACALALLTGCPHDRNGSQTFEFACLGDSHTNLRGLLDVDLERRLTEQGILPQWCEIIPTLAPTMVGTAPRIEGAVTYPTSWRNVAAPGAMVTRPSPTYPYPRWAQAQFDEVKDSVDVIVAAFGANDLLQGRSPEQIVAGYRALVDQANAIGITAYVGTVTPFRDFQTWEITAPSVDAVNALIRTTFPNNYVDFDTGFVPEDYAFDGIHLNTVGERLMAERVRIRIG